MYNKLLKKKLHFFLIFIILIFNNIFFRYSNSNIKKKIGIIGLEHSQNVGNNLLKYAIFIKLTELGFDPYIIGRKAKNHNISFIKNVVNLRLIKNFSEIKENEFDILMVNSDQTWRKANCFFYDVAFLRFAEKWKIPKFIYGTSLGLEEWKFNKEDEIIAKHLLKNFKGISVRELGSVELIEKHLGIKAQFVLDPTLLINNKYYINLIKDYKSNIINKINNKKYIFAYIIRNNSNIRKYLSIAKKKLNSKLFILNMHINNQVKEFLYGVINSKAVITDSFHGTIFSLIFKKPFISFIKNGYKECRFNSLDKIFNIRNRIFDFEENPPVSLLEQNLIINKKNLIILKRESIKYIKKNLYY